MICPKKSATSIIGGMTMETWKKTLQWGIVGIFATTAWITGWGTALVAEAAPTESVTAQQDTESTHADAMLYLVNQARKETGARPLQLSEDLMKAAAIRAKELTERFSHTRPDGSPFYTILGREQGIYTLGENAAAGSDSVEAICAQWMESPAHRRNILDARFNEIGIGHFYAKDSEYKHYWIQIFRS